MPTLKVEFLDEEVKVPILRDTDIIAARQKGKSFAAKLGFSMTDITMIATAISELARNILMYAKEGEVIFQKIQRAEQTGMSMIAIDQGSGISNIEQALKDGFSTGQGLGLGLPGTRRLMDEFEIQSEIGKGTVVRVRKWVR